MVGRSGALLDVEGLLSGQGVSVEKTVDRVGPETQVISWKFKLNDGEALPLGIVWFDSDFVSCGGDSRETDKKKSPGYR